MELKGSKTEANLMAAFAGESQARNKYTYYASQARKDGYVQIANIFEETAANEKEHAKMWFKLLHGGSIPGTAENLEDAATAKIMSGPTCTPVLRKRRVKRGLIILLSCLRKSQRLKKNMKNVTASCLPM